MKHITALVLCAFTVCSCQNRRYQVGTQEYMSHMNNEVIIDCDMILEEALANVPEDCPEMITKNLALVEVFYFSFDHRIHRGQLLIDYRLADDVHNIFAAMLDARFPLYGAVPIDHSSHNWDYYDTLPEGNTYSFHYRNIVFKQSLINLRRRSI
ncbi:MAG: hypothetical protein ACOCWH_04745, partial [Spirochaetota bacterium]